MKIKTKVLGEIILDTSMPYFLVLYKIPNKGYRDRNKGEMFFSISQNIKNLNEYYITNQNLIIQFIDDYDYIKESLDKYILNNIFEDEMVLRCLTSILENDLIDRIIEYLKCNITNVNIKVHYNGLLLPDIKDYLKENITLYNRIKDDVINIFGNDIIISYYNLFNPPDFTIVMEQDKIKINVVYEVEKGAYNTTMSFRLDEKYNITHSFFDYIDPGK
jgi:hypothetical protein